MKKLSLLLLLFASFNLQAQVNLLGISTYDGYNGNGFIYKLQNGSLQHVYDFMSVDENGKLPTHGLVEYNGLYYGVTNAGGEGGTGVIFSYDYITNTISVVHNFDRDTGYNPASPLILYNNKLYGYTMFVDQLNCLGTFYEFDPATGNFQIIYHITDSNQGVCSTNMIIENDILYGTFQYGGANHKGTLYSLDLLTHTYTVLHHFENSEGSSVFINPVLYNDALYGIISTSYPQSFSMHIYKYDLSNNSFALINDFSSVSLGYAPAGNIVLDNDKIYGTTNDMGSFAGHIYRYDIDTDQLTSLYDITDNQTASLTGLVKYGDVLYGMTNRHIYFGNPTGEVYSYNLTTGTYQYHFAFQKGASELNFITKVDNNTFLGLRKFGGSNLGGEIFEADLSNNTYQTKYSFNVTPQGAVPYKELIQGNNGKYYGMIREGGYYGYGGVFEMDNSGNLDLIYDFPSFNHGYLIPADDKIFFIRNNDFVSVDINTHQFNVETNLPFSCKTYINASNGKIYLFEYDGGGVYEFDPATGGLIQVANDNNFLYIEQGATEYNGKLYYFAKGNYQANHFYAGFLLSYDLNTQQIELVKEFDDTSGSPNYSYYLSLSELNGKLYGHTVRGGANNYGTLFEYNPANNLFRVILDLTEKNNRSQKLLPVGNHTLLGTFGDKIMAFDVQTATQDLVYDLTQKNIYTSYASLLDLGTTALDKEVLAHFDVYPNPMQDVLHVENKDDNYAVTVARIYDISGEEKINTAEFDNIDVSKLSKGIYILQLQLDNGNSVQQLLLKK